MQTDQTGVKRVITDSRSQQRQPLEAIQTAMHEDPCRFVGAISYFVLGSSAAEERP